MQILRILLIATAAATALVTPASAQKFPCAAHLNATESPTELLVGVVVYDKVTALDHIGPTTYLEMFGWSGVPTRFISISNRVGRIQPDSLMPQHASVAYADAPTKLDVLLIPGGPGDVLVIQDAAFLDYLTTAAKESTHVLSVCTGANILASTGVLDGRNATTNKGKFKTIAAKHPNVNWMRKSRWVVDGKFWTSSGVSAGLDMGHAFVGSLSNSAVADCIAEAIEIEPITDPSNDPFDYVVDRSQK